MQQQSESERRTGRSQRPTGDVFCCAMMLLLSGIFGVLAFGHWPQIIDRVGTQVEWVKPRSLVHIHHYALGDGVEVRGTPAGRMSPKLHSATVQPDSISSGAQPR